MVRDLIRFLDNVLQAFIDNAPKELIRAKKSALRERSLGLGAMGFHGYLQKYNTPFESAIAKSLNRRIFKHIKDEALLETKLLATERGTPGDLFGSNVRNAHFLLLLLMPTIAVLFVGVRLVSNLLSRMRMFIGQEQDHT